MIFLYKIFISVIFRHIRTGTTAASSSRCNFDQLTAVRLLKNWCSSTIYCEYKTAQNSTNAQFMRVQLCVCATVCVCNCVCGSVSAATFYRDYCLSASCGCRKRRWRLFSRSTKAVFCVDNRECCLQYSVESSNLDKMRETYLCK